MFRAFALALCLVFGAALPAGAGTPITYTKDGRAIFSVDMPDFWLARSGGPRAFEDVEVGEPLVISRVLALEPETAETAWLGMMVPDGVTTLDEAEVYITNLGKFLVEEPRRGNTFARRVGGLPARVINGTGARAGTALRFSVILIDLPGSDVAVIVALAANDAPAGVIDEINGVVDSLTAGGQ